MSIAFRDTGSGHPVVLLHAFPFSGGFWRRNTEAIVGAGFRAIIPDLPGFGESRAFPHVTSMALCAQEVFDILDVGGSPVCIVGLSMGGYVALEMLRQSPERISALILCDTTCEADSDEKRTARARLIDDLIERGSEALIWNMLPNLVSSSTRRSNQGLFLRLEEEIRKTDPAAAASALRGMAEREGSCSLISEAKASTHFIFGQEDAITDTAVARFMHARVKGSTFELIPRAGHLSNIERPQEFNRSLMSFLNSLYLTH